MIIAQQNLPVNNCDYFFLYVDFYFNVCYNCAKERGYGMKKYISVMLALIFVFSFAATASARLVGDVNSDGSTNSTDALLILQHSVGKEADINEKYADVNADGAVNSSDALVVLQISVGSYKGDLEVEDEIKTSFKKDVVDPIISSGTFTLKTQTTIDGEVAVATTMLRDKDLCVETTAKGITVRVLTLSSKTYLVIPDFIMPGVGVYMKYDQQINPTIGDASGARYVKSENVTVDGEELVCETYELNDGTVSKYYFKEGKWVMLSVTENGETTTQKVLEFKKGVDDSKFSLKGLVDISSKK